MTAPERIWAGEGEYWHKPHVANPTAEYILHTRTALAASPLVQEIVAEAVKAEREACTKVLLDAQRLVCACLSEEVTDTADWEALADDLAAAIRARGEGQPQEKGE